jgi:alpha-L-fucosidase
MTSKTFFCFTIPCILTMTAAGSVPRSNPAYEALWESLSKHEVPEWFRDAKFGIYTHWGPVTVGAEDGPAGVQWYGRSMYTPDSPTFEYHRKKYGDQNEVGYKDVVPLFKAEKFNAEAWAQLFAAAGAKFAGPVAIHHDNYAMWDSKFTEWDSMDQAPKRDFAAELEKAIRKRGMKYVATFHHAFAWQYYEPAYKFDAADGIHAGLYCEPHEPGTPPSKAYLDRWLGMVNEVVAGYEPDLIWFDFGLSRVITPEYQQRMFADYYTWAAKKGIEVAVAHKHRNIHQHTGILDFERGREDRLTPYPWLTDTSIGPWFHQKSTAYKSVDDIVDVLVDIVSKNGCLLLNVGPAADGTIPPDAQKLLRGIGRWLSTNGEAIFETRPWKTFGEGPTRNTGGGFSENKDKSYTSEDIRFTQSKDGKTVYVIVLGWPERETTIRSMRLAGRGRVELLGYRGKIEHRINNEGQLVITPPRDKEGDHAFAFRLKGFQVGLHPEVPVEMSGTARSVVDFKIR